jgi:hypothetical protein
MMSGITHHQDQTSAAARIKTICGAYFAIGRLDR